MTRKIKVSKVRERFREESSCHPFFYGVYIRLIRRSLGYSLENVAGDLHISKGNLSEMENGLRPMKREVFETFLSVYGLPFNADRTLASQARTLIYDLFEANLRFDEESVSEIEKDFAHLQPVFLHSYAHFYNLLIDYFLQVIIHLKEAPGMHETLIRAEKCFSNDERALIYFIRGMEHRLRRRLEKQDAAFRKALDLSDEKMLPGFHPLIQYYQVQMLTRHLNPFEAFVLCGQTRRAFYSMHNYIRALYLDNSEALCLMSCRQYSSALKRLKTIQDNIHFVRDPFLRFCVVQNQILMLTLMDEFEAALDTARTNREIFADGGLESFALCAYCLFMLRQEDKALEAIEAMRFLTDREEQRLLFRCLECAIRRPELLEPVAERMLSICDQIPNYQLMELTYKLLIHHYSLNSQQEKLLAVQTRYIAFLNRQSSRT